MAVERPPAGGDASVRGLFTFLFAARGVGWLIALLVVAYGARPEHNMQHEPRLLIAGGLWIALGVAYVPLLRTRLPRALAGGPRWRQDLLAVSAIDMVVVFAVLHLSGGYNTPYYHYAVVALMVPTSLLGWRGSLATLTAFLAALVWTWSSAGLGTGGPPWVGGGAFNVVPGLVLTPVLVVVVGQALFWLVRRYERGQRRTERALERTAALYRIAQAVSGVESGERLVDHVLRITASTGHFASLTVWCETNGSLQRVAAQPEPVPPATGDGATLRRTEGASPDEPRLTLVDGAGASLPALPIYVDGRPWGALAYEPAGAALGSEDRALLRAVAGQISLGLTRLVLSGEKAELAALEERARIAREIHDGIAQSIYMLSLNLERAAEMADAQPALSERLRGLVGVAKEALLEVRQYIFDLKPLLAGDSSLGSAIAAQLREFGAVTDLAVRLEIEGDELELPVTVASALYRLVQEALANAYRHAAPSRVLVRLEFAPGEVRAEVCDDGRGFDLEALSANGGGGRGLRNIRERVAELGGAVALDSAAGAGTTVRVAVPVAPQPAELVVGG
jgi:signal transduction histidine kinase